MAYYQTCPHCAAALDPGERCDCLDAKRETAALPMVDDGEFYCRIDPVEIFALSY